MPSRASGVTVERLDSREKGSGIPWHRRKLTVPSMLLAVFILALGLRVIAGVDYPFHPDAAYFAWKAQQIYYMGHMFELRPIPTYPPLWPYLIAYSAGLIDAIARTFGLSVSGLLVADVYLPPLAGSILCIAAALLGRVLYDWRTGVIAGFAVAIAPLAIADSARGATDHDAFSLALIVLTVAAFIACYKAKGVRWRERTVPTGVFWLVPGLLFTLSLLAWKGSIAVTLFIGIVIFANLLDRRALRNEGLSLKSLGVYTGLFFLIPTIFGIIPWLSQGYNVALTATDIFANIAHYFLAFLAGLNLLPHGSLSLLFPTVAEYQTPGWQTVLFYLGLFNVLAPLGLVTVLERPTRQTLIAMLLLVVAFAAAFRSTDLAFLAIPFVSVSSACFVSWLMSKSTWAPTTTRGGSPEARGRDRRFYLALGVIALFPAAIGLAASFEFAQSPQNLAIMPNYWFPAFDWMRTSTCNNSLVFSWWDYGYWVSYWGERLPVLDNGYQPDQTVVDVANTIIGSDPVQAQQTITRYAAADGMNRAYFMITSNDLSIMPIIRYAATFNTTTGSSIGIQPVPVSILKDSVYYRLFFSNATLGSQPIPGFQLAYDSPQVKIFAVSLPNNSGQSICR